MGVVYQQTPNPEDLKRKQDKKNPNIRTKQTIGGDTHDQAKPDPGRIKKIEEGKKKS